MTLAQLKTKPEAVGKILRYFAQESAEILVSAIQRKSMPLAEIKAWAEGLDDLLVDADSLSGPDTDGTVEVVRLLGIIHRYIELVEQDA